MVLPQSHILTTRCLNRVFDNTSATYKFYWLLGLLELSVRRGKQRMSLWEVIVTMVANAWYPVNYFLLSFGKADSLGKVIGELRAAYDIPMNARPAELKRRLTRLAEQDPRARSIMNVLQLHVPYRFLSPWIKASDYNEMVLRSQSLENGALYKLEKTDGRLWITMNPVWMPYLEENYKILEAFAYWGLANFLQVRNPNVPNISGKLVMRESRNSLARQHHFWDAALNHGLELLCPYTLRRLYAGQYDLDHFIPWSFVAHDLLWNLVPADSSVNSSKSNKLPDLDCYLPRLAEAQQAALKVNLRYGTGGKLLDDYFLLKTTARDICAMDKEHLLDCFFNCYKPMQLTALNMGFEQWRTTEQ